MYFDFIYKTVLIFLLIFLIISAFLFFLSYYVSSGDYDSEKISAYECGFEPFSDSRINFDVRFYLVAILFIIFDLEIIFLFPWSISLFILDYIGFFSMLVFFFILTVGFFYEWMKGALDWE